MREIINLLDELSKPYVKQIYSTCIILGIIETVIGYFVMSYFGSISIKSSYALSILFIIGILAIMNVHRIRIKQIIKHGGMTRIRLLPIANKTFMCSELLFIGSSVIAMLSVQYIVAILLFYLTDASAQFTQNPMFLYVITNAFLKFLTPITIGNLLYILMGIAVLTFAITIFVVSLESSSDKISSSFILLGCIALILLVELNLGVVSFEGYLRLGYLMLLATILFVQVCRLFHIRKRGC